MYIRTRKRHVHNDTHALDNCGLEEMLILTLKRSSYFYARSMAMKTKFSVAKTKLTGTPV